MDKRQVTDSAYAAGDVLGDYRLELYLGQGDNAVVWLASNVNDGTMAALRLTDADRAAASYAAALSVEHPCIVRPTAMFNHGAIGVTVMQYYAARSVEGLAGYTSESQAWALLRDISSALDALHSAGMTHGNVCAENILWDGDKFVLTGLTNVRADLQTKNEELRVKSYRSADDIWQLGATVFYLCMGCHVFNGLGMKAQKASSPLPYMRKSMPRLSEAVQRCLAYDGRPSAHEITAMATEGLAACDSRGHSTTRTRRETAATGGRDWNRPLRADFWPDEMRRVVALALLALCCLALPAQSINDAELSKLVSIAVDLRDNTAATYDKVKTLMLSDASWTPMSELGPLTDGECPFSDKTLRSFKLNSILNTVDHQRKPVTTHGDGLNGEDRRYKYSLYERSVRPQTTVSYTLQGREGAQTFVIVPFTADQMPLTATAVIDGKSLSFAVDKTRGVLVCNYAGRLTQDDRFTLTVSNSSNESQAFVIINYNTREL